MSVPPIRLALGAHLGQVLTPDIAAHIEHSVAGAALPWPEFLDPATGKFLMAGKPQEEIRAWIKDVAHEMVLAGGQQDFDEQVKHTFLDGMYMRELFIPKGTLLIGKVHRLACMNLVTKGDISILTEHGSARVKAGHTAVSEPGIQKMGYAHEDTVFVNVFRTDETQIESIDDAVAFPVELPVLAGEPKRRIT